ncbi:putative membrane protein YphA (DoxX/SURF4 family) [Paenibacillus phyllosphaerae]|uniref:Putative membrane protein YphA (DoxX/SURF4 family) n=1 Tax=Paenibacillus phyllosphaerae TaxID=274593 RepID=A0A7W5B4C0_9BACL|nr:DoxX family protein [Paenibacillus phyllosphaerae]MBB3114180.1 putative membrane protein YphA (DoxX/SURF4 family) [Paenibacillus phyllosphaerae]
MSMRGRTIAYWSVTLLLAAAITLSGIGQLMQVGGNLELVTNLGYPVYIMTILGIWKLLGVIAIVVPGLPRLKEWAYAGIFFLMSSASLSHIFAHDYGDHGFNVILPLAYALLSILSWALRPKNRILSGGGEINASLTYQH